MNDYKLVWVINKVKEVIFELLQTDTSRNVKDITIACSGLTFKADIDDLCESLSMNIAEKITKLPGGKVIAVEPNINDLKEIKNIVLVSIEKAFELADVIVLLFDH